MCGKLRCLGVLCPAFAGILLASGANCPVRNAVAADEGEAGVELNCKISSEGSKSTAKFWKLDLKTAAGQPIRRALAVVGDKVRFKNLEPGMYVLCLGDAMRESCESVDLHPPSNQPAYRFTKQLPVPEEGQTRPDGHRVSAISLAAPGSAREQMIEAERAQLRGEPQRAMQHLLRAVEIYPDYVDALNNLGTYYQRAGDHDQAIALFYRVVDLEPGFYGGWVNLGGCLMAKGEFQQALKVVKRALELRPNDPLVMGQYALANYYLRDYDQAKKYFIRVLKEDPAAANSPQLFLAQIEISRKNMDAAVGYMQDFLKWHPNAPEAIQVRNNINNLTSPNFVAPNELARTD